MGWNAQEGYPRTALWAPGKRVIQIDLDMPDRPGELAKLTAILGEARVNIDAMSAASGAGRTYMSLLVDQPTNARQLLEKAGYRLASRTVLVVRLPDRPGALAKLAADLAGAGVDVQSVVQLETMGDHVQLAIGVDNLDKARSLV